MFQVSVLKLESRSSQCPQHPAFPELAANRTSRGSGKIDATDPKPTWCAVRWAFYLGRFLMTPYVACDNRTLPIATADLPKPGLGTAPYFQRVKLEDHVESACGSNEHIASTKRHKDA
jgi:hypothetical protein